MYLVFDVADVGGREIGSLNGMAVMVVLGGILGKWDVALVDHVSPGQGL